MFSVTKSTFVSLAYTKFFFLSENCSNVMQLLQLCVTFDTLFTNFCRNIIRGHIRTLSWEEEYFLKRILAFDDRKIKCTPISDDNFMKKRTCSRLWNTHCKLWNFNIYVFHSFNAEKPQKLLQIFTKYRILKILNVRTRYCISMKISHICRLTFEKIHNRRSCFSLKCCKKCNTRVRVSQWIGKKTHLNKYW